MQCTHNKNNCPGIVHWEWTEIELFKRNLLPNVGCTPTSRILRGISHPTSSSSMAVWPATNSSLFARKISPSLSEYQCPPVHVRWLNSSSQTCIRSFKGSPSSTRINPLATIRVSLRGRLGLIGDLRRVPREAVFTFVARQLRRIRGCNFHSRCDGHANTLTVILHTKGNIFGGSTPVEWESTKCSDPRSEGEY
jgi:hypothetical protein